MPAALLVRWAALVASLASVALPVCVAASPVGRPSGKERTVYFVRPLGHQSHGEAEGRYAPLSMLVAPTIGLLSNTTAAEGVTSAVAGGARYVERSHVLRLLSGRWKYLPVGRTASVVAAPEDPTARLQIAESRDWLAGGRVPGDSAARRATAERALLAMRALLRPNGAMAAGWSPGWMYSWPRDSSFASAAFAHTGHDAEAYRILRYSAATQRGTAPGTRGRNSTDPAPGQQAVAARRQRLGPLGHLAVVPDGASRHSPRPADRPLPDDPQGGRPLGGLPRAERAASGLPRLLGGDDDHRQHRYGRTLVGRTPRRRGPRRRAGPARGRGPLVRRRRAALQRDLPDVRPARLSAHRRRTARTGQRGGLHGAPFNTAPADLPRALDTTYEALLLPNGGLTPGNDPTAPWGANAWTPSTSFFALAWAGTGQPAKARQVLDWVLAKRNPLGELPEKVDRAGRPSSVAPLGWTASIVVLTLVALDGGGLPTPPPGP